MHDAHQLIGHLIWLDGLRAQRPVQPGHSDNKCFAVSPQSYCWHGSHTAKHVYENASSTHSILCSAVFWMHLFPWALVLVKLSASVKHLNASWMVLDAFGRIIENQRVLEQHSLAVRNIQASFGLWNSIPQPHLNSNKQLWIYSYLQARAYLHRIHGPVSWILRGDMSSVTYVFQSHYNI